MRVTRGGAVGIDTYILDMLQASRDTSVMPFASVFPGPHPFSLQQLNHPLIQASKIAIATNMIEDLSPGNTELRHTIARRHA